MSSVRRDSSHAPFVLQIPEHKDGGISVRTFGREVFVMTCKRILVLFGGCSSEHEVSLVSGSAVIANLDASRYEAIPVGITKEGRWLRYTGPVEAISTGEWCKNTAWCTPCAVALDRGANLLMLCGGLPRSEHYDAVFPVLHGRNGEDGTVQGLFELAGAPLIGCGTLSSALCMDKDRAHRLAALAGVEVPKSFAFGRDAAFDEILKRAGELGWPLFVKPVRAGSSFGVSRVKEPLALPDAVREAFQYDSEILLEEAVPGFEVGCAVLGSQTLITGAVDEIELSQGFFDYTEKYTLKTSAIHCPARIPEETAGHIQEAARKIYRALGCRDFARVDMFLTPEGRIVFNEVNTIPGFTSHSRYPSMMKAAGIGFSELLTRMIELEVPQQ